MNTSNPMLEELDFEDEANMVEEPKSVKECSSELTSLPSELVELNKENRNFTERGDMKDLGTEKDPDVADTNMVKEPKKEECLNVLNTLSSVFSGTPNIDNQNCSEGGNQLLQQVVKETENNSESGLIEARIGKLKIRSETGEADTSNPMIEELDFEMEANMVEEPNSVEECSSDLTSLPSEIAELNKENQSFTERGDMMDISGTEKDPDVAGTNMIKEQKNEECLSGLKTLSSGFSGTSNLDNQNCTERGNQLQQEVAKETVNNPEPCLIIDKIGNTSGSEAGEIDHETDVDSDVCSMKGKTEKALESEGEIDREEMKEVEDGEISECYDKKTVCRFFLRGYCYFGPQCQFLHVCNKVYNMFDQPPYKKQMNLVVTVQKLPFIHSNPPAPASINDSSWEKGLETAKVMIKNSIKKKMYDVEFEEKKLYISPESPPGLVKSREKASQKRKLSPQMKSVRDKPSKVMMDAHNKKERHNPMMSEERSHYDWVDPWMRSNKKDPIPYIKQRKRQCSISSTSSNENLDRSSANENPDAERAKKKRSFNRSCSRSYSRSKSISSRSRSRSSSRSHSSDSEHSPLGKRSPSYTMIKRSKRKSSSIEKWFKKEVSAARRSRSLSFSSNNSAKSYGSSVTLSSLSCSSSDSVASAFHKGRSVLKKAKRFPETKVSAAPIYQHFKPSASDRIRDSKEKPLSHNPIKSPVLDDKSAKHESVMKKAKISEAPIYQRFKPSASDHIHDSKQKTLSHKNLVPDDKSAKHESRPLSQATKNKSHTNRAAFKELFRYQNIKSGKSTPGPETEKCKDLDCSSDCKKMSPSNPRRNITLNLQPPKDLKKKPMELPSKQPKVFETAKHEKGILSKKETLLKQLKLVEQAIAKKKCLC